MNVERIREELHALLRRAHDAKELKLLNVGTARKGERHWRFQDAAGQIVTLTMEVEPCL